MATQSSGHGTPKYFRHRHRCLEVSRTALTILELTIAVAVLALLLATSMKVIHLVTHQQRANERRNVALQTVQAISEQVGNTPWEQLSAETANQITVPAQVASYLPGAKLAITVSDETDPAAKRVLVELTWNGSSSQRIGPVRLTSWVFPDNTQN
ncbi:MAG: hypothetical protein L0228_03165 [Planctomycetes bacterium]|nr:hypothetical protein [Planctomycetota bacterium]